jgi:hypothetical protein
MAKGGVRVRHADCGHSAVLGAATSALQPRGAGASVAWTWEVPEAVIAPRVELRKVPEVVVVPRFKLVEHPLPIEPVCVTLVVVCVET